MDVAGARDDVTADALVLMLCKLLHGSNCCSFTGLLDFVVDTFQTMEKLYFGEEHDKVLGDSGNFTLNLLPDEHLCSAQHISAMLDLELAMESVELDTAFLGHLHHRWCSFPEFSSGPLVNKRSRCWLCGW